MLGILAAGAIIVWVFVGGMMLTDALALSTRLNRTVTGAVILTATLVAVALGTISGVLLPILLLTRGYAAAFVLIGAYNYTYVFERDHLAIPLQVLPFYLAAEWLL